ncbi:PIN domain-containing protein [Oceanobacillus halotolerans]|uniref:PIN domain-containing protein n=1 Tax=Oceanobacillus halotolerans TaxID=2663380 RepID=UPI0013DCC347|nr:PIN domain-containing protein [Oceanobacillus halotolerans]
MSDASQYLVKKLDKYRNKGYAFSFDTNILMDTPNILEKLKKETIWISRKVYEELDSKKASKAWDREEKKKDAAKRREALRSIEYAIKRKASFAQSVNESFVQSVGLESSRHNHDDYIIASYIKKQQDTKQKALFITADRGARAIALSVGLEVVDFDIPQFKDKLSDTASNDHHNNDHVNQAQKREAFEKKMNRFLKESEERHDVLSEQKRLEKVKQDREREREERRQLIAEKEKKDAFWQAVGSIGTIIIILVILAIIF